MNLILARHGQSTADIEHRLEGRYDSDLTEIGYFQAGCVAKWISENYKLTSVLSSPFKRAYYTATAIASAAGIDVIVNDDLMEWNNGILAGMLKSEADIKYPSPKQNHKPYDNSLGMESLIEFRARIEGFWREFIDERQTDENVCIVSHGGTIKMLFASILGLPIINDVTVRSDDGAIHIFKIENQRREIVKINFTGHLKSSV